MTSYFIVQCYMNIITFLGDKPMSVGVFVLVVANTVEMLIKNISMKQMNCKYFSLLLQYMLLNFS